MNEVFNQKYFCNLFCTLHIYDDSIEHLVSSFMSCCHKQNLNFSTHCIANICEKYEKTCYWILSMEKAAFSIVNTEKMSNTISHFTVYYIYTR